MDELPGEVKQAEQLTVADVKRWHWGLEHGDVWDIFFFQRCWFVLHLSESPLE